ncbi:DUF1501 domain-containing protein [soil metagenome]
MTSTRNPSCHSFRAGGASIARRTLLKAGGMGLLGLTMPQLLRASEALAPAPRARAKSVIFLFQWGGPSHLDMFDMKPGAPEEYRGPYRPIRTRCPDIEICEKLPALAGIMDKVTLVRSVHHKMKNHNSAGYYALTGKAPPSDDQRLRDSADLFPGYGSVVSQLAPPPGDSLPGYVSYPHVIADGSKTPGQHASFLGKDHDPLFIPRDPNSPDFSLPELSLPKGLSLDRLQARRGLQQIIDGQSRLMETSAEARGMDRYYDRALRMLGSEQLRGAFDLSAEPAAIRDAYGRTEYGQGCLLARRLVEHGVKFVTCYFSENIGGRSMTEGGWDTHGFDDTRMFPIVENFHFPITDHTLPTLIFDLERRGMLEETLVVWMGEFGRTPKINENVSRDHWPDCYTVLLAGGGVKRGYVYGSSDEKGERPAENPVTPDDVAATIYHLLGIDPKARVFDLDDRPHHIADGTPILPIIA